MYPGDAILYSKEDVNLTSVLDMYNEDVQKHYCDARGVVFDMEPMQESFENYGEEEYDSDAYEVNADGDEEYEDDEYDDEEDLELEPEP